MCLDTLLSEDPAFRASVGTIQLDRTVGEGTVALRLPSHLDASLPKKSWPSSQGLQGGGRRNSCMSVLCRIQGFRAQRREGEHGGARSWIREVAVTF